MHGIKKLTANILLPLIVALFNVVLIFYPKEIIEASRSGIELWFQNVFPSLLPFLIGTSILSGLGVVHFIGTILEPLMIPLFGIPGCGGFALICGMTSGYPMGAKITSELRQKKMLSKIEAQRLISFTNNSGPLFVIGAVGMTMFHNVTAGYFILILHYLGALTVGLLFKHYRHLQPKSPPQSKGIISRAYKNMKLYRLQDQRSFPILLSDSVKNSMETIFAVGGFIILFSVIGAILELSHVFQGIQTLVTAITGKVMNENLLKGFLFGFVEVTNGAKILSQAGVTFLSLLLTTFIVSFGGFSIHSQSISFIAKTDMSVFLYLCAKLLQGVLSVAYGIILYPFFNFDVSETATVFFNQDASFVSKLIFSSWSFLFGLGFVFLFMLGINFYNTFTRKPRHRPSRIRRL